MDKGKFLLLVGVMMLLTLPAQAWEPVQVTQAAGHVWLHLFSAASPTPWACYWEQNDPILSFHATNADADGNMDCTHTWLAHCDSDSLAFHGSWPQLDFPYLVGAEYLVELWCDVTLPEAAGLHAERQVAGVLTLDEHILTVEREDGSQIPVLLAGGGPDQAYLVLDPGTYRVTLTVHVVKLNTYGQAIPPYSGRIALWWSDPGTVAAETISWDLLKSAFHR